MKEVFNIKRGDTSPGIRYKLSPPTVDLNGASVSLQMMDSGGVTVLDRSADIFSVNPPIVEYGWQVGDTDNVGWYRAEWKVTYGDGSVETFPNKGYITVRVNRDVPDKD